MGDVAVLQLKKDLRRSLSHMTFPDPFREWHIFPQEIGPVPQSQALAYITTQESA